MLNVRLILAGVALTLMSAYVVVNMNSEAEATCYYITITDPEDGAVFYEGDLIEVWSNWELPGDFMDDVDVFAELRCTMTDRLEDSDVDYTFIGMGQSDHFLTGPTEADSDVADDFCIFVLSGAESDRIGATFIPYCICCP